MRQAREREKIVPFHSHALRNGLQIMGETSPSARSVALGFFVQTGSRDETHDVSGVTHFLEHMVFKGTPRRSALDVNRDFDKIGASYNAFTSEENTVSKERSCRGICRRRATFLPASCGRGRGATASAWESRATLETTGMN